MWIEETYYYFISKMNARDAEYLSVVFSKLYGRAHSTQIDVMYQLPYADKWPWDISRPK